MKNIFIAAAVFFFSVQCFSQKAELILPIGHIDNVSSLCFSSDGKFLATGSLDKTAKLWDVVTGKEIRTFFGHTGPVTSVALSSDGKFLLTGSKDSTAILWDVYSGKQIKTITGHQGKINAVAISADKKYLLTGSSDKTAKLWDFTTGKELKSFSISGAEVRAVGFDKDSKLVIIAGGNNMAEIFNVQSGTEVKTLSGLTGAVNTAGFSKDGKFVFTAGDDNNIILWETSSGKKQSTFIGHTAKVLSADISADGKYLLSGSADKTCKLWDAKTGKEINTITGFSNEVSTVAFMPGGKYFAAGSLIKNNVSYENAQNTVDVIYNGIGYVKLWELPSCKEVRTYKGHSSWVNSMAISKDGKYLLTGSYDKNGRLWNLTEGRQVKTFIGHTDYVTSVAISPDDKYALTGSADNSAILWDVNTGKAIRTFHDASLITSVAFNSDGTAILTAGIDRNVKKWDVKTGNRVSNYDAYPGAYSACFSPDDKSILIGSVYEALLYDASSAKLIKKFKGHKGDICYVAFSPDGKQIVTCSYDNTAKLWDIANGNVITTFTGHTGWVYSMAFSPDKNSIVTGSADNTARLWNVKTGTLQKTFTGHTKEIETVAYSGNYIFTGSLDNSIKIWDASSGKELASLVSIDTTDYVVTDPEGMFDASAGAMMLMHYTAGLEPIALEQLKDRYYEPALLAKHLGFKEEKVREAEGFSDVKLYPEVNLQQTKTGNDDLRINLKNQGGGIGKVVVYINGKEIASDARGEKPDPNAKEMNLSVPIKNHPYLKPDGNNVIEVKAYNSDGYLSSRGIQMVYNPDVTANTEAPRIFIVASGVSDYTGDKIDLKFAAKDATDMLKALQIGANRLFGADKTFTYLLTTDQADEQKHPTKANITKTFESIAKLAKSTDVIVVYLSGHGMNLGGQDGDFFYLTQDAYSASAETYGDPAIKKACTISSAELTEMIKKVPALKEVLIIDACASGKMVENLIAKRDVSSSTLRALDRMKDRTGMHIITGCTADAVSYEASRYGQGLLTYSILEGIKGFALRENEFVDVSLLFQRARDRVPELAAGIGGIQKPEVFSPYGAESFDIGKVISDDKPNIPLAKAKPMVLMTTFQDEKMLDDVLGLEKIVDDLFRNTSAKGKDAFYVFLETKDFPDAYRVRGQYNSDGNNVKLKVNVFKGKDLVGTFNLSDLKSNIDKLAADVEKQAEALFK
jgi:WD40 repeat protein